MRTHTRILDCSIRLYVRLLSLYPARFRARFGGEMLQIFGDSLRQEDGPGLPLLWGRTLKDLAFSLPLEWRRQAWRAADVELDYTGLADAFMITIVVGVNLIGWGAAVAAFALGLVGVMDYSRSAANLLLGIMTLPMAALVGILCALVVARGGRVECNRITARRA